MNAQKKCLVGETERKKIIGLHRRNQDNIKIDKSCPHTVKGRLGVGVRTDGCC